MVEEYLLQILIRRKVSDNMYQGSIKIRELEKEIGKENLDKYLKMIREEFAGKEKVYLYFMQYERFEDKYTNPYLEKKGNYLLNSLLYDVIGKKEYKRIGTIIGKNYPLPFGKGTMVSLGGFLPDYSYYIDFNFILRFDNIYEYKEVTK